MSALSPYALTSLGAARAFVLRDETNGAQDTLLTTLINGESKTIRRFCNRQFFKEDATTKTLTYNGSGYLDLAPFELRALTSMTLLPSGGASPLVLDTDEYSLEPSEMSPEATYFWISLASLGNPGAWPPQMGIGLRSKVEIVGDWGMATVAEDAEEACLMAVRWRYKNPDGQQNVQVGDFSTQGYSVGAGQYIPPIPAEALSKLELLRRPDIGV